MIKQHSASRTVVGMQVDDVFCNKCGTSMLIGIPQPGQTPWFEGVTLCTQWGYHSSKDGTTTTAHICEKCHDAFAATFVIPLERFHNDDLIDE